MLKRVLVIALVAAPAALAAPQPVSVTIGANRPAVVFGDPVELSGAVSPPGATSVTVAGQTCAGAPRLVRSGPPQTLRTGAEGGWSMIVTPLVRTTYQAKAGTVASVPLTVDVRPRMTLTKTGKHRFHVHIAAAISFDGSVALFQERTAFGWKTLQSVYIVSFESESDATTSGRTFRSGVARRQTVRMLLPQGQVGDCYTSGTSNTIRT